MEEREEETVELKQELEDVAYSKLPDTVSEYKTVRVASRDDYIPNKCRACHFVAKAFSTLKGHIGYTGLLRCPVLRVCIVYASKDSQANNLYRNSYSLERPRLLPNRPVPGRGRGTTKNSEADPLVSSWLVVSSVLWQTRAVCSSVEESFKVLVEEDVWFSSPFSSETCSR
jgi:hypothetical protein